MNRIFKIFLLWLLIAALPVQGIAAAMRASCGPKHHESLAMIIEQSHDHSVADAHHAHHHDQAAANQSGDASAADADKNTTHKSSFCSACSMCCSGAITQSEIRFTPVPYENETRAISPVLSFTGYIPAGLERPPRHLSA